MRWLAGALVIALAAAGFYGSWRAGYKRGQFDARFTCQQGGRP